MSTRTKDRDFGTLTAPRRNRFYYGKLMDVLQFETDQTYHRRQQALANRLTVGKGVLCGLSLRIVDDRLELGSGSAIDGMGHLIEVPHSVQIDPWGEDDACPCCEEETRRPRPRDESGTVTIWLCYRECVTDLAPALVDDCATPDRCEAGTTVETYCIRLTDGAPEPRAPSPGCEALGLHDIALERDERIRLRRTRLCELLDAGCEADPDAACVPIATVELTANGTIGALTVCPVRPRLYSNDTLLELILCLADRIEECCRGDGEDPEEPEDPVDPDDPEEPEVAPFHVTAVRWIATGTNQTATELEPRLPLMAEVPVTGEVGEIDIEFSRDVDDSTVTPVDLDMPRASHSILVLNEDGNEVVPGTAELIASNIVRFSAERVFLVGRYRLIVAGDPQPDGPRPHLRDVDGNGLDGEPDGLPSGDGIEGGDFVAQFTVQ